MRGRPREEPSVMQLGQRSVATAQNRLGCVTEPRVTEPRVTEPRVTEPCVTEPRVAEPCVTEPCVTEPRPSGSGFPPKRLTKAPASSAQQKHAQRMHQDIGVPAPRDVPE